MRHPFREKELDKISKEILNQIYPTEGLFNYYHLGIAETLNTLDKWVNTYDGNFGREEFKQVIDHLAHSNETVKNYYFRLEKDR